MNGTSRLETIFDAAIERNPAERDAFILEQCGDNPELVGKVRRLVAAHEAAQTFMEETLGADDTHAAGAFAENEAEIFRARMSAISEAFPEFEFIELIGRGGMGEVYKARQRSLDRIVAIKILPESFGSSKSYTDRFIREAQAMALLSHPNIITVHDYGQSGPYCFLSMEFVDGVDLRRAMDSRNIAPGQALGIVRQLCDALEYAHSRGVVHRDIKPSNILLDRGGRVRIADFGLAKIVSPKADEESLTTAGQVVGTPSYMAPEQRFSPGDVDHRADIYSLGVVFYEMLTGELPMGKFEAPSKRVEVDVRLDEIVLRTLEREPSRRYQHASEIKSRMEQIESRPDARRWLVVLAAAALIALSVFAIQRIWPQSPARDIPKTERAGTALKTIHDAASRGTVSDIAHFIGTNADIESKDEFGRTPLLVAAWNGNLATVAELLARGASMEAADPYGYTPLGCAAEFGHVDVVRLLLSKGAKRAAKNAEGADVLMIAAGGNEIPVVKLLLAEGFDVKGENVKGNTAVHGAAAMGWPELLELLLKAGAEPAEAGIEGNTALHMAAYGKGYWERKGRIDDVHGKLASGNTFRRPKSGDDPAYLSCVRLLLDAGAPVGATNAAGDTPLHLAAQGGDVDIVKLLLARGAKPAAVNGDDFTPFERAVLSGQVNVVRLLLETPGAAPSLAPVPVARAGSLDALFPKARTPLHLAASAGQVEVANLLIERGSALNAKDDKGATPLHWAVSNSHPAMIRSLLKAGADIEAVDLSWWTPLHLAVERSTPEIVQILVEAGANLNARDLNYTTPGQRAEALKKHDISNILRRAENARKKPNADNK